MTTETMLKNTLATIKKVEAEMKKAKGRSKMELREEIRYMESEARMLARRLEAEQQQ